MEKKINLAEILNKHLASRTSLEVDYDDVIFIKRAMLEACTLSLELAADNAILGYDRILVDDPKEGDDAYANFPKVDKISILNTINQIE